MAFEHGAVSFRAFRLARELPDDAIRRLAAHAAPPLESITAEETAGWVSGRHLLDRTINEDTAYYAGILRVALRLGQRKIPPSLLQAECRMEELARMAASNRPFLNRTERSEIRKEVAERLLPGMPPQLKAIPLVHRPGDSVLYAGALSVAQSDLLASRFLQTFGFHLVPLTPGAAALARQKIVVEDLKPASFSPDVPDEAMTTQAGREFLTWLWYVGEAEGGTLQVEGQGEVAILIEGPLTFVHEGNGAHETVLRRGEPVNSAEAKTCLLSGKKLRQAKLTLAVKDEIWKAGVDADEFVFRSLMLPEPEPGLDPTSRFLDRLTLLDRFRDIVYGLYDEYLARRRSPARWQEVKKGLREWVKGRTSRI